MFIRPFKSIHDLRSGTVEDSVVRKEIDLRAGLGAVGLQIVPETADLRRAKAPQSHRIGQEIVRSSETELDQSHQRLRQETADPDTAADRIQIVVENHLIVAAQID